MTADYDAFAAEHVDRLLRLARVLTGSREEAEDLTQETLARTLVKWGAVSRATHPAAYVRRMLVNVHLSRARRPGLATVPLDRVAEPAARADSSLEDRDALRATLASLPRRQRTVLVLRYYEDLAPGEIAEAMGLRESSVRSAQARALVALQAALAETEVPRA